MWKYIRELIHRIEALEKEYDTIEDLLFVRQYPRFLLQIDGFVNQKTLIAGCDNDSLAGRTKELREMRKIVKEQGSVIEKYKEVMKELCTFKCDECNENVSGLVEYLENTNHILDAVSILLEKTEGKLEIKLPKSKTTIDNGKKIRTLLKNTQATGRATELLFVYFLKSVLKEHGQIRRDYADIQLQTNVILSKLIVTAGIIQLDGYNLSVSIRNIIKDLANMKEDLNALRVITVMLMIPAETPSQIRTALTKLLEKGSRF